MHTRMEATVEEVLSYVSYCYQRRTKSAEALAHFPRASQFEKQYLEDLAGAGAADYCETVQVPQWLRGEVA